MGALRTVIGLTEVSRKEALRKRKNEVNKNGEHNKNGDGAPKANFRWISKGRAVNWTDGAEREGLPKHSGRPRI